MFTGLQRLAKTERDDILTGCLDTPSYEERYQSDHPSLTSIFSAGNDNLTVNFRRVKDWGDTNPCNLERTDLTPAQQQDITLARREGRQVSLFGRLYHAGYKFTIHRDMVVPLNGAVVTIDYFARVYGDNYGRLKVIGQGGTLRDIMTGPSFHYHGKAIDIWWVGWENQQQGGSVVHTAARPCNGADEVSSGLTAHRRLVAVEAGLRK